MGLQGVDKVGELLRCRGGTVPNGRLHPVPNGRDAVRHSIRDAVRHAERWQAVRCQGRCRAGLGGDCPAGRKDWESGARKARSSVEGVLQKFCGAEGVQLVL